MTNRRLFHLIKQNNNVKYKHLKLSVVELF